MFEGRSRSIEFFIFLFWCHSFSAHHCLEIDFHPDTVTSNQWFLLTDKLSTSKFVWSRCVSRGLNSCAVRCSVREGKRTSNWFSVKASQALQYFMISLCFLVVVLNLLVFRYVFFISKRVAFPNTVFLQKLILVGHNLALTNSTHFLSWSSYISYGRCPFRFYSLHTSPFLSTRCPKTEDTNTKKDNANMAHLGGEYAIQWLTSKMLRTTGKHVHWMTHTTSANINTTSLPRKSQLE